MSIAFKIAVLFAVFLGASALGRYLAQRDREP